MIPNQWLLKTKIDIDKVNSLAEQGEYALIDHGDRSTSGDKSKQWAFSDANLLFDFVIEELKKANPEKHLYDMDLLPMNKCDVTNLCIVHITNWMEYMDIPLS